MFMKHNDRQVHHLVRPCVLYKLQGHVPTKPCVNKTTHILGYVLENKFAYYCNMHTGP